MNFIFFVAVLISTISGMATGMCFKRDHQMNIKSFSNQSSPNQSSPNQSFPDQSFQDQSFPDQIFPNQSLTHWSQRGRIIKTFVKLGQNQATFNPNSEFDQISEPNSTQNDTKSDFINWAEFREISRFSILSLYLIL